MADNAELPRLILGSGRSGTTWVLDCIADANELRPVFEPLHPGESTLGSRYAYQLMLPGDQDETLERYFRELAAGHVRSRWTDYRGRRDHLFPNLTNLTTVSSIKRWLRKWRTYHQDRSMLRSAARREGALIKCIRANLMAGWLTQTIGFRTVLIVRHPGAVMESQYRLGPVWDPTPVLDRYRSNRRLHEVTDGRYLDLLNSRLTTLQALTLNWIIENQWPVARSQVDRHAVSYYEDLVSRPASSWQHLCDSLGLARVPDIPALRKPSQQASRGPTKTGEPGVREPGWRLRMTREQLDTIQGMLDATECDLYDVDGNEPLRSNLG